MLLSLSYIKYVIGIYGKKKNTLPKRMRWLHPAAARSFARDLAKWVVVSDMFRSAESSLWAIQNRKGSKRPGTSGHNFGLSIDLNVTKTLRKLGMKKKRQLDNWMEARGWYCHRRDHRRGWEDWHYNFLGPWVDKVLRDSDPRTSWALERLLKLLYGRSFKLTKKQIQERLHTLGLYGGEIDGKIGPLSREAVKAFQRTWKLTVDGIPGTMTQRTLAYVPAERIELDASQAA
jgi:hypothetical protein